LTERFPDLPVPPVPQASLPVPYSQATEPQYGGQAPYGQPEPSSPSQAPYRPQAYPGGQLPSPYGPPHQAADGQQVPYSPAYGQHAPQAQAYGQQTPQAYGQQAAAGPYGQAYPTPYPYAVAQKSRFVAAVLAFFFGVYGIHNFYLGYNGRGFVQLGIGVLGTLTAWLVVGIFLLVPLWVWVIVEIILLLTDKVGSYSRSADGVPLS